MKLSKLLLSAMIAGIAVTSTTSCTKKDKDVNPQTPCEQTGNGGGDVVTVHDCPACGMG